MTIMLQKHFVRFYFILIYGLSLVQEKNLYKMCMQINHCKNKFFISQPTQNTDLYFNFHVAPFHITQQIRKFENNSSLFLSCSTFWTSNCKRRFPEEEWIVLYRLLHVCTIFFFDTYAFNFCLQEYKIVTISSLGFGCCHFMPREKNYYNVRRYEQ